MIPQDPPNMNSSNYQKPLETPKPKNPKMLKNKKL